MGSEPDSGEFRLRSVAVAAFAPATLFGLAEGAMLPVIVASTYARGASTSVDPTSLRRHGGRQARWRD